MPTLAISKLLLIDIVFLALLFVIAGLLARSKRAAYAVLKRNFLGYFSNPTGYVFLCLFVLLTSMAAFWPHEFFSSNLATLGQLNKLFPIIMLFFIPAITMSIWADERRQGTDELLLTLPADDFDIVIGKFLASAAIYTASLIFSQVSTFLVLVILSKGNLDTGLFVSNYFGYWFIGLAMLAIGMIASFLTSNLTVGFILGALFNAPLAFAAMSDVIFEKRSTANLVSLFSIKEQFDNFGRGVLSISSIAYFSLLVVFGLYFCMVLIGKRHWSGGKDGNEMSLHYIGRTLLLAVIVLAASYFFHNNDFLRYDSTEGQVSSLSPTTRQMIRNLKPERSIVIDAFLSADVPEQYAKTKYDLTALLKEFQSLASSRKIDLEVRINDNLEPFSEEAALAEKQYGIQPQMVRVRERGAYTDQKVLLGAAFRCGLQKIVVPFFENGIPVEYELVRSINTVAQPKRKKLGIVRTDAQFMGGFSMAGGSFQQLPRQPIIDELEKQFELEEIDPSTPISTDRVDVLMAVQPSSLGPQELTNLVEAVKAGVPTAIFEDPFPFGFQRAFPGTGEPKQSPGGQFGGGGPMPKGDIQELWKALGLVIPKQIGMDGVSPDVVWQQYNPYPKLRYISNASDEWVFIREEADGAEDALSEASPITAGLRELMFLYSGAVQKEDRDDLKITDLASTGTQAGTIKHSDIQMQFQRGEASSSQLQALQGPPKGKFTLAVLVEGKENSGGADEPAKGKDANPKADEKKVDEKKEGDKDKSPENEDGKATNAAPSPAPKARPIRAVYVADTDCMLPIFIDIRKRPEQFEEINFRFQNVTFVLNVIDVLAGETGYPEIRRHEPQHSTLQLVEEQAETYRQEELERQREFQKEFDAAIQEAEGENRKSIAEFEEKLQKLQKEGATDVRKRQELISIMQQMQQNQAMLERKLSVKREGLKMELDKRTESSRRQADIEVLRLQNTYKMLAIFLPPIPPLLVGIAVFVSRRVKEREGISKNRLR